MVKDNIINIQDNKREDFPYLRLKDRMDIIVKVIIKNSIPYTGFGQLINAVFFDIPNDFLMKRIEMFMLTINERLDSLENGEVILGGIVNEKFHDMTISTIRKVVEESEKEKIEYMSKIYLNSILSPRTIEEELHRSYINCVHELKLVQIKILRFIKENPDYFHNVETYEKVYSRFLEVGISKDVFKMYFDDLKNKSLIKTNGRLLDFGEKDSIIYMNGHTKPSVFITEIGEEFIKLIAG